MPFLGLVFVCLVWNVSVQCCRIDTFEGTRIYAIRNVELEDELTDYNFFTRTTGHTIIPIHRISGCITPEEGLEEAVAILIREERVPIFYEGSVQDLPLLHSIHVISSGVHVLSPGAFQNLPSLSVIKIQDNDITEIPAHLFNNLAVRKLILTFNNIALINPEAFNDMPRLESVKLDFNRLSTWSTDWFVNCPRVEYLSVKFNNLSSVPARAFRNVQDTLERLYLSNNRISSISPRAFAGLRRLTDLSLQANVNLNELDELTFLYLEHLKVIDLSETDVTCLGDSLLNTLRRDVLLWIDNIPLNSTCKAILEQWAMDNENSLTFYKTLRNNTAS